MATSNPYASPRLHGIPWHSKTVRYFPLDIKERRLVAFDIPEAQLGARIVDWAKKHRFRVDRDEGGWTLTRGTLFDALFSFTVEHLPTTLTLKRVQNTSSELQVDLHCHSLFSIARPGDPKRISRELQTLEELLLVY